MTKPVNKKNTKWRKHLLLLAAAATIALTTPKAQPQASEGPQKDPCANITTQQIEKHAPLKEFQIVTKTPVHPEICQVVITYEGAYIPLYMHNDFLIIGDYFSNRDHPTVKAIQAQKEKGFVKDRERLNKAVAFTYKPKQAKKYIFFVTDPDCAACNTSKKAIRKFADDNNVELKVIFYPLPMHPNSKDKVAAALCSGKFGYNDYLQDNYPAATCKKGEQKAKETMDMLEKMGVEGTPAFITSSGSKVIGFDPQELKEML